MSGTTSPPTHTDKNTLKPRERQRIETRQKVFQAAIDEYNRVGIANAQIEKITRAAGVSVGTYYRYFPTKDAVIFELLQQYMARATLNFGNIEQAADKTLQETLLTTITQLFDFLEAEDSPLLREIFALLVRQQAPDDFDWATQPFLAAVLDKFQQAKDNGETDYEAIRLTRLFFTSMFGFITSMNPVRRRTEAIEFVSIFLKGVQKQGM